MIILIAYNFTTFQCLVTHLQEMSVFKNAGIHRSATHLFHKLS